MTKPDFPIVAALESVLDFAICGLDPQGRVTWWNRGAEALFGYSAGEVLGRPHTIFFLPAHREADAPRAALNLASAEGHTTEEDWRIRKDGSRVWTRVSLTAYRDAANDLVGFVAVLRDTTGERARHERFRVAVESAPSALVLVHAGRIVLVNRATERLFGYDRDELVGRTIEVLVPERFRARHPQYRTTFGGAPQARPMGGGRDLFGLRKDGTEVPVEIGLNPIETDEGRFVLVAIVDLTERKRIEAQIRAVNASLEERVSEHTAQLRETIHELERFTHTVAHDLRAPLRAIHRYADLLTEEPPERSEQSRVHLDRIRAAAHRMDRLTTDLLTYSRVSRAEVEVHPVALDRLLRDLVEGDLSAIIQDTGAAVHVAPSHPPVCGDEFLVLQVLSNLLSNALKFRRTDEPPRVDVRSVETPDGYVRVLVEDNGIGLDPTYAEKVFQIFERLHDERSYEGTGIGLAIVAKAVDRLKGRVGFDRREDGPGTRFWVEIPGLRDRAPSAPRDELATEFARGA